MPDLGKEVKGHAKSAAGAVSGNDELREEGEAETQEVLQQEKQERAGRLSASTGGGDDAAAPITEPENTDQPGVTEHGV